jgi:hypothetical protein
MLALQHARIMVHHAPHISWLTFPSHFGQAARWEDSNSSRKRIKTSAICRVLIPSSSAKESLEKVG